VKHRLHKKSRFWEILGEKSFPHYGKLITQKTPPDAERSQYKGFEKKKAPNFFGAPL
jgi:hypothetical protein